MKRKCECGGKLRAVYYRESRCDTCMEATDYDPITARSSPRVFKEGQTGYCAACEGYARKVQRLTRKVELLGQLLDSRADEADRLRDALLPLGRMHEGITSIKGGAPDCIQFKHTETAFKTLQSKPFADMPEPTDPHDYPTWLLEDVSDRWPAAGAEAEWRKGDADGIEFTVEEME